MALQAMTLMPPVSGRIQPRSLPCEFRGSGSRTCRSPPSRHPSRAGGHSGTAWSWMRRGRTRLATGSCSSCPPSGLPEAFGNGEELASAEFLLAMHHQLDPAGLTPGDLKEVVDRIVVEQSRVAVHHDCFPPGHRNELGLVSRPQEPILASGLGDHQLRTRPHAACGSGRAGEIAGEDAAERPDLLLVGDGLQL